MRTSVSTVLASGLLLCGLSLFVLTGWLVGSDAMVRVMPGTTAMAINTAVLFLACGGGLVLSVKAFPGSRVLHRLLTVVLFVLPSVILIQHIFRVDLGVDWASVHAALGDGHAKPGRTAPNACGAFIAAATVFWLLSPREEVSIARYRTSHWLGIAAIAVGVTAFLGYTLKLEALYRIATYNQMAALTALGVAVVGIGLTALARSRQPRAAHAGLARQVTGLSAALLTLFALATSVTAFAVLKSSYERSASQGIWHTAKTSASGISSLLDKIGLLNDSIASRPLIRLLLASPALGDDARFRLQQEVDTFLALGFTGVQVVDAQGATLASTGELLDVVAQGVLLPTVAPGERLLWKEGFLYHGERDVVDGTRVLGRLIAQRPLPELTEFVSQAQSVARTSDVVLCARDGLFARCFPSRFYKEEARYPLFKAGGVPSLPISRALLGESGSASVKDSRGVYVLSGFTSIPKFDLALEQKIETAELYDPLSDRLLLLVAATIVFITVGTLMLRRWVRPLVQQVASERQRMTAILDNSHDAFVAVRADGVVSDWNREAEHLLGWSAEEAIGRNLAQLLVRAEDQEAYRQGLVELRTGESASALVHRRLEATVLRKDGSEIPVELSVATFRDGNTFGASAFLRDLTQQKEAERELEQAREALAESQKLEAVGKLTGGVAHDFNNVLQVISGNLQLIRMDTADPEKVRKRASLAINAADRGAKLATQLLAFARKQPLQPRVTDLCRVVSSMRDMVQQAVGEPVRVEVDVADRHCQVWADPHQLEQVLLNLAINARDAMPQGGTVRLSVRNAGAEDGHGRVLLEVKDTGMGMPREVMERAFEPFFTTKAPGKGTGLGLSMAYGFVKQSGGHIELDSAPGQGTAVRIFLPEAEGREEVMRRRGAAAAVTGGSETILVVEDDASVQATVLDLLAGLGYRTLRADNAEEALAMLEAGAAPDLVFTDVVMPGKVRSPDLARRARELLPNVKVLFTSGYAESGIVRDGLLQPGVHLLRKPYEREQLAAKLRELLGATEAAEAEVG